MAQVIALAVPDVILLQNIDYDFDLLALSALKERIAVYGHDMPHVFALAPNTGLATGLDMNGDGRIGLPHDAQSFGQFQGQGGMAILSRHPIDRSTVLNFSEELWTDLPDAKLPQKDGAPFPSKAAKEIQRLSSTGHWLVPIALPNARMRLIAFHAGPHVFDGPEDKNGLRNHDEIALVKWILDAHMMPSEAPVIALGNANIDPLDGGGRKTAIRALLMDERLQDPKPRRHRAKSEIPTRFGNAALHTVDWPEPGPGPLRVSYILPQASLTVVASGIWDGQTPADIKLAEDASRHRLVWVDIELP